MKKIIQILLCFFTIQTLSQSQFPAGVLDTTFGTNGVTIQTLEEYPDGSRAIDLVIDAQNRIVIGGYAQRFGCIYFMIARFLQSGQLDTTFGINGSVVSEVSPGADNYVTALTIDNQNRILAVGVGNSQCAIQRYLEDGTVDTSFNNGIIAGVPGVNTICNSIALDSQQRIIIAGAHFLDEETSFLVIRLLQDGTLDTESFGNPNGYINVISDANPVLNSVIIDASDSIYVAGQSDKNSDIGGMIVIKLTQTGDLDLSFGTDGILGDFYSDGRISGNIANQLAFDGQGNLFLSGTSQGQFLLFKFTVNGQFTTGFGDNDSGYYADYTFTNLTFDNGVCSAIEIDPLKRMILLGTQTHDENTVFVVARVLLNSLLDQSFGAAGFTYTLIDSANSNVFTGALNQQGKILLGGSSNQIVLARYTTDYTFAYYQAQFADQPLGFLG